MKYTFQWKNDMFYKNGRIEKSCFLITFNLLNCHGVFKKGRFTFFKKAYF